MYNIGMDIELIEKSNIKDDKEKNFILYLILKGIYQEYKNTQKINMKEFDKIIKLITHPNIEMYKKIKKLFEIKFEIEENIRKENDIYYDYKPYFDLDDIYFKYPELKKVSFFTGLIYDYITVNIQETMLKEYLDKYEENDIKSFLIINYIKRICKEAENEKNN